MRYERINGLVYVQWLDKCVATVLSTMHSATSFVNIQCLIKVNGTYEQHSYQKPAAVELYNKYTGGVDVFDQLA